MKFIQVNDTVDVIAMISNKINDALKRGRVFWLVSGGSNISIESEVSKKLDDHLTKNLKIMLADERYGEYMHQASNYRQLIEGGFRIGRAQFIPVLTKDKSTLGDTVKLYAERFKTALNDSDFTLAELGMGGDGHIAGILPGSRAVTSENLTEGYESGALTRMTLTVKALVMVNEIYACVFGEDKKEQLQLLYESDMEYARQPAQILKLIPNSYVYNSYIGGST